MSLLSHRNTSELTIVSTVDGLSELSESMPQKANKFIPKWWSTVPYDDGHIGIDFVSAGNVKKCPSFIDYFSKGYVIPMWTDSVIRYDSETLNWEWRTPNSMFSWSFHGNPQYLDFVDHKYLGKETYFVFKIPVPWRFIASPGYSILQLPTFFHFHEDFSVMPGIRDADKYYQVNLQVLVHSDKKEIFIKRGTPLAHIMPYKREKETLKVYDLGNVPKKIKRKLQKFDLNAATLFPGSGFYLKDRKKNNE